MWAWCSTAGSPFNFLAKPIVWMTYGITRIDYKMEKLLCVMEKGGRYPVRSHIASWFSPGKTWCPFWLQSPWCIVTANFAPIWGAGEYQLMLWKQAAWTLASGSNSAVVGHTHIKECTFLNKSSGHVFSWHAFLKDLLNDLPLKGLCGCLAEVWCCYSKGVISVLFCTWILYWGSLFLV